MLLTELKPLIQKLNECTRQALEQAAGQCVSLGQQEITVEHLLLKLLGTVQSDIPLLLRQNELDTATLVRQLTRAIERFESANNTRPSFSPLLLQLLQDAWLISSVNLGASQIRSGAIFAAFLARAHFFASADGYLDSLHKLNRDAALGQLHQLGSHSIEHEHASNSGASENIAANAQSTSAIGRFCENFTEKARAGGIDPVFGRDPEIRQMVDILARRRKNNPICVGDPGVGKTAVVEGLALRIAQGDVPPSLQDVTLLGLDLGMLQAGASVKGEFENRLKGVINEIKASPTPIILFIDEAHTLIGAGGQAGTADAANLLKPALARGELRTIAATTWTEYKKYFEKDPALARRFQPVKLEEPDTATATLILRGLRERYQQVHQVSIRDDAIVAAAELSARFITGRQLPDKAVDLLDTACARVKVMQSAKPDALEDTERQLQALEREKLGLQQDADSRHPVDHERLAAIDLQAAELSTRIQSLQQCWQVQREAAQTLLQARSAYQQARKSENGAPEINAQESALNAAEQSFSDLVNASSALVQIDVTPEVVAQVVSSWTGIPVGKMQQDQARTVLGMADALRQRIQGQDMGLDTIADVLKTATSGVRDPQQPLGVFLLVGPSGVGKTETALAVADLLFGDEKSTIVVNMSEFQERHNVSRLIGSPPGYVGYGEGGMLTEAVRQRPYAVVLLDEVEKAHLDVMNLFYQVFDKGVLSDGEGKDIDFSNTVIFLTSNLATDVITEMTQDGAPLDPGLLASAIRPILSAHFKPALLARMTVVPYTTLNSSAIASIVRLKLDKIVKRLAANNRQQLHYTEAVVHAIAQRCTEVETGARNIDFILRSAVLPRLSQEILARMGTEEPATQIQLDVSESGDFSMQFA